MPAAAVNWITEVFLHGTKGSSTMSADFGAIRSSEFPLTESWAYLNHAGTGPLPRRHVKAASAFLEAMSARRPPTSLAQSETITAEVRDKAARLLSCAPNDIAVLSSTVQSINIVPLEIDWREGDEAITYERDYPSVVYSLLRLEPRGVLVRMAPDRGGRFELADILALITKRARLVSLSLVHFATGFRAPIEELGRICRERGIWLVIDAIQAIGSIRVDVGALGADIVAAQGYKHLLSGYGVAICYCSQRAREELGVPTPSWAGTENHTDPTAMLDHRAARFTRDARRFESAVPNFAGLFGAAESLDLLLSFGTEAIEKRIFSLLDEAARELSRRGCEVVSSLEPSERSGLLSFRCPSGTDEASLLHRLAEAKVACSLREGMIRLSPHFYNDWSDFERLFACLPRK